MGGGKKVESNIEKIPYVIFSDDKRYWNVFEPICREFDNRGVDVVYMTGSSDDPVFSCGYKHVKGEFVGKGNLGYAKLNFINAHIVLSTTPGLDVYQWKRSRQVDYYVHIPHAAGEITLYRMFGIDYYDALLLANDYQVDCVRKLENLRSLPPKELYVVGIPHMDEMVTRLQKAEHNENERTTVLLAPSWGPSAIFSKYGGKIIEDLLKTGYKIIIRPHPQSFESEKALLEGLMKTYPDSDTLTWNRDVDNFQVLVESDILISDFSGVVFEFALVYDKPVMYANAEFDKAPYDAWWLEDELWTFKALPRIGMELTDTTQNTIKDMIDTCLYDPSYERGRAEVRQETWECFGEGSKRTVNWLISKYKELAGEGFEFIFIQIYFIRFPIRSCFVLDDK